MPKSYKIYGLKVYTKTIMDGRIPKMYGVIEGPIHQMLLHFPKQFEFVRHESKRTLRPSARSKSEQQK